MPRWTPDRNTAVGCPVMGRTSQEVGVMPKEVVYDHATLYHSLTIGWNRDPGGVGVTAQMCTDAGPNMAKAGPAVDVHLDRDGINRLIRTLRKARDQAFGADA